MNLVPSVSRSADTVLLSAMSASGGVPRAADAAAAVPADLAEPITPAFMVSLAALVAQVEQGPDPVRPALELSRLTVTRMAEELGIPRATLAAYRLGTRRMPAANRARLGAYLAAHAEALTRVAQALRGEGAAKHPGNPAGDGSAPAHPAAPTAVDPSQGPT